MNTAKAYTQQTILLYYQNKTTFKQAERSGPVFGVWEYIQEKKVIAALSNSHTILQTNHSSRTNTN